MRKIQYLIIALLCAVAQGAWAQTWTEVGDETALNNAITDGANIKLMADIPLTNYLGIGDGDSSTPTVTLDLNGYTLSRSLDAADGDGHVIWVRTGSTLTVMDSKGSGKLTGGYANNGGGINNYGTLHFQSGTITGCKAASTGGAIRNNGTCYFEGGVIDDCWSKDCGGIYNNEGCTLEISGGSISGCTSKQGGGGVNNHGTAIISGGSINNNHATSRGGGVWNGETATLTITGGSITGNTAETNGGGVFSYSTLSVGAGPVPARISITGNTVDGSANNLYLNGSNTKINVTGSLEGATIGITLQKRNRVITSGYHDNNGSIDPTTIFFPDYSGHRFFMEGNEVRHTTTSATATTVATEEQLNTAISQGKTEIQLMADITLNSYVEIGDGKTVTLDLNGYTLSRSLSEADGFGSVIFIEEGSTLYVKDSSGDNSGKLTGGYSVNGGGIRNHGTLTFAGGTITSCMASSCGGGIYNAKASENATNATLYMTGGVITGNTGQDCGGIYNAEGSTTEISGGTISNCTSNQGGGGINNKGTMTISGGTISGNHASERGGGVWNGGEASLTITGGTITGNRADTAGGGVFTYSDITMSGSPNITGNEGSNLYLNGSTVINCAYRNFTSDAIIGISLSQYNRVITKGYSDFHSWSYAYEGKYTCFSTDVEGAVFDNKLYDNDDMEVVLKDQNGVEYFVCSWTGSNTEGHVVKTKKLCKSYTQYSSNTDDKSLNAGWYVFKGTFTFNKRVTINGDANFILKDGCSVEFDKGIHIPDGKTLTIYAQSDGDSKGYLWTDGSDGENAAIGGNNRTVGGHLVIHGGKIYAKPGSNNAAGIGGGEGDSDHATGMRSVTIWDGTVEAYGKSSGAGIGGGEKNDTPPSVTIYGGNVTAKCTSLMAAGIGGGEDGGNGTIKIYGGIVNASSTNNGGSAIGGGYKGAMNYPIYIYGGTVNATGNGAGGAGIGSGEKGNQNADIYIYGGNITAKGATNGAAIGGGSGKYGEGNQKGTIYIYGGNIEANGGNYAAGIGGGYRANGGLTIINGGTVIARAGGSSVYPAAGIGGGGNDGSGGTVIINGGYVEAEGEYDGSQASGAGIGGGGNGGNGGTFTINGGKVKATSHCWGVPIGFGGCSDTLHGDEADITIASNMMVYSSVRGGKVAAAERESICQETNNKDKYVIIEVCDHENATYASKDDNYHTITCSYCLATEEAHTYDSDGACTKCNHTAPANIKTVTLYIANADGSGYDNPQISNLNSQSTYALPSCSNVHGGLTFIGWAPGAPADGEAVTSDGEETLMAAGTEIAVTDDVSFKARYERVWNGSGNGTEYDPFLITSEEDWNTLAANVSNGTTYSGCHFLLAADISVSTMVGQGTNRFQGKFDGAGHTLTVSYTGVTENYCAPFRHISGATIKNLNTTGTIETSGRYAAGVVAYSRYYSRIENCRSSVVICSNNEGWAGHGGILGLKANVSDSKPTIEGCVFDGKILSTGASATTGGGGIVGLTNGQTLTIKNCLYKPAALDDGETAVAVSTIYANSSTYPSTVTCENCYYTEAYGSAESGTRAYTVTSGTEGLTLDYGTATTDYGYNGIKAYSNGLLYGGVVAHASQREDADATLTLGSVSYYTGATASVTFTPKGDKEIADITATGGTLTANSPSEDGETSYTLTMPSDNVTITATFKNITVALVDGQDNDDVLAAYAGQTVNVSYDRVLSAVVAHASQRENVGTAPTLGSVGYYEPRAHTVCLPYDLDLTKAVDTGQVMVCGLFYVKDGNELIFSNVTPTLKAGFPYLIIVNEGELSLNAENVTLTDEALEGCEVYDWDDDEEVLGYWRGTLTPMDNDECAEENVYSFSTSDGNFRRIRNDAAKYRSAHLNAFRGAFFSAEETGIGTLYTEYVESIAGDNDITDVPAGTFDGDTDFSGYDDVVGIMHVITTDGTHQYYDLQGRHVSVPSVSSVSSVLSKGVYIHGSRKVVVK